MKRTIAFLDVLGFRKMVETKTADSLGAHYELVNDRLEETNKPLGDLYKSLPSFFPDIFSKEEYCIKHIFSDSIILISNDETEQQCLALLIYALRTIQHMLMYGMPVRGGVVHDEIYLNINKKIVVGKALTRAFDLELCQNWIGTAIDNSVIEAYPNLFNGKGPYPDILVNLFPEYEVPMKSGPKQKLRTLNWRWNLFVDTGTRSLFEESVDLTVQEKVNEALKYAKYIRDANKAYPADQESTPVEVRKIFRVFGPPGTDTPTHGDEF